MNRDCTLVGQISYLFCLELCEEQCLSPHIEGSYLRRIRRQVQAEICAFSSKIEEQNLSKLLETGQYFILSTDAMYTHRPG